MATERLQKVLARAGVASRRAAEELIAAGRVRVDGRVVTELGTKVDPRSSKIEVDGKRAFAELLVYVVLHKPRNVVSTMSDPEGRPTVHEYLKDVPGRVYPVGRLDFSTSGVLLATNDGDFAAALLHPRKAVPKTYVVKVVGLMQEPDLERWRKGVRLQPARSESEGPQRARGRAPSGAHARDAQDEGPTLPAKVKLLRHEEGKTWLQVTITEGRNQQIRRMGDATGFRVMRLARLQFAGIDSEALAPGRWRYLTYDELSSLKKEFGVPKRLVSPPAPAIPAKPGRPQQRGERRPWRGGGKPQERQGAAQGHAGREGQQGGPEGQQGHPRYGGGSPGRRDVGVTEDWGGGIRRGSSGSGKEERAPRDDVGGGRGGRTRTTGTSGGVGAGEGNYRVKGRRGW